MPLKKFQTQESILLIHETRKATHTIQNRNQAKPQKRKTQISKITIMMAIMLQEITHYIDDN